MKRSWQVITISGIAVLTLACILGGKLIMDNAAAARLEAAKEQTAVTPTPSATGRLDTQGFITSPPAPKPTTPGAAVPTADPGSRETITQDKDGNVTIIPDWSQKPTGTAPSAAPSANLGGGGGALDLDENGTYHGDHPGEVPQPDPTATPAPTQAPSKPSEMPRETPAQTPAVTPKPTTPPADGGNHKNGEISSDGKYAWVDGFGWVERGPGSTGEPSKGTYTEVGGEQVGTM